MLSPSPGPETTPSASRTASRQQPGLACEQCRARKWRCDRKKPQCGGCKEVGVQCTATVRQPRGPKKGHLKAMQSRLSALEGIVTELTNSENCVQPTNLQNTPRSRSGSQVNSLIADDTNVGIVQLVTYPETQADHSLSTGLDIQQSLHWEPMTELHSAAGVKDIGAEFPMHTLDQVTMPDYFSYDFDFDIGQTNMYPSGSPGLHDSLSTASHPAPQSSITNKASSWQSCPSAPVTPVIAPPTKICALVKADLNHLFFDRIHTFIPLLNQRRFLARASCSDVLESFRCLQHAMWTLAATTSSQFQHIQTTLYSQTRKMLEALEWETNDENTAVEQAQSWALLAIYEITQVNFQRGWLSAGRCFRLVQLKRLHLLDCPQHHTTHSALTWVELEEQRRTFWVAYSLDRFINLMNQLPLMLTEQVVTRLPAPEAAFQRGQSVEAPFLSQVMASSGGHTSSPFTESIVLVTICGRCLSHQQNSTAHRLQRTLAEEFWRRHQWLESTLSSQVAKMLAQVEDESKPTDSMLLFTFMTAHATALSLCTALESRKRDLDGLENAIGSYEARTSASAHQIVNLAQRLSEFSLYKVHPLTPIPLILCAEFARGRMSTDLSFQAVFQSMCNTLRELSPINRLAQVCLRKLGQAFEENVDYQLV